MRSGKGVVISGSMERSSGIRRWRLHYLPPFHFPTNHLLELTFPQLIWVRHKPCNACGWSINKTCSHHCKPLFSNEWDSIAEPKRDERLERDSVTCACHVWIFNGHFADFSPKLTNKYIYIYIYLYIKVV